MLLDGNKVISNCMFNVAWDLINVKWLFAISHLCQNGLQLEVPGDQLGGLYSGSGDIPPEGLSRTAHLETAASEGAPASVPIGWYKTQKNSVCTSSLISR